MFIGGTAGGASFEGLGSANELYNVALSQGQIAALMAGGSPPSGLVGDWQLNEGTGSTATDSSTYGDNGTWNGTASGNYGYYEGPTTTTYTSGTATPRQPGFDSTLANNTSAEFAWNAWSAAPNNTLGSSMEWNTPWSLMVQVDNLQWTRTGTLVLASKGDLASGNWWELYLHMTANTKGDAGVQLSQLCFARHSAFNNVGNGICTSAYGVDIMPNGFNYNIVVTDSGTGASGMYNTTSALDIYVNGLDKNTGAIAETPFTTSYNAGFGSAIVTYSGGGTGYANSTAFTSSGGGANCNIAGHMTASGGVPNGILPDTYDYGCTGAPTLTLTSPTGTGTTLTAAVGTSMNSTSYPLMVPGYVSGGAYYGVAGATGTQTPTYIDEFAVFPFDLNLTQINDLFYWTKFYQGLINKRVATSTPMLVAMDGCPDIGNPGMLQLLIVMDRVGILKIEGVIANGNSGAGTYDTSASIYRQMLDQAGLSNVPVGVPFTGSDSDSNWCTVADVNTYDASTPKTSAGFPTSLAVARTVMAENPATPVFIFNGSAPGNQWLAAFMQSSADSISSLTGTQLWDPRRCERRGHALAVVAFVYPIFLSLPDPVLR